MSKLTDSILIPGILETKGDVFAVLTNRKINDEVFYVNFDKSVISKHRVTAITISVGSELDISIRYCLTDLSNTKFKQDNFWVTQANLMHTTLESAASVLWG